MGRYGNPTSHVDEQASGQPARPFAITSSPRTGPAKAGTQNCSATQAGALLEESQFTAPMGALVQLDGPLEAVPVTEPAGHQNRPGCNTQGDPAATRTWWLFCRCGPQL
jgi:hypothetical protein